MLQDVPAMLDCVQANVTIQFTDGREHVECIELDSETFDVLCEIEYMLFRYIEEGISDPHDADAWCNICLGGTGCVFPTDEQDEAINTLVAISDTYLTNKSTKIKDYQVVMVDHLGNNVPYQIERQ